MKTWKSKVHLKTSGTQKNILQRWKKICEYLRNISTSLQRGSNYPIVSLFTPPIERVGRKQKRCGLSSASNVAPQQNVGAATNVGQTNLPLTEAFISKDCHFIARSCSHLFGKVFAFLICKTPMRLPWVFKGQGFSSTPNNFNWLSLYNSVHVGHNQQMSLYFDHFICFLFIIFDKNFSPVNVKEYYLKNEFFARLDIENLSFSIFGFVYFHIITKEGLWCYVFVCLSKASHMATHLFPFFLTSILKKLTFFFLFLQPFLLAHLCILYGVSYFVIKDLNRFFEILQIVF